MLVAWSKCHNHNGITSTSFTYSSFDSELIVVALFVVFFFLIGSASPFLILYQTYSILSLLLFIYFVVYIYIYNFFFFVVGWLPRECLWGGLPKPHVLRGLPQGRLWCCEIKRNNTRINMKMRKYINFFIQMGIQIIL